jgi:ATP-dependent Clp protease ATP-binding subunit ClpA
MREAAGIQTLHNNHLIDARMSETIGAGDRCTERGRKTLRLAAAISRHQSRSDIEGRDLLIALWNDACVAEAALESAGCPRMSLPAGLPIIDDEAIKRSTLASQLMDQARVEAHSLGHTYAGTEHQLLALMRLQPELVDAADRVRAEVLTILGHGSTP